jgi:hypothetical protein
MAPSGKAGGKGKATFKVKNKVQNKEKRQRYRQDSKDRRAEEADRPLTSVRELIVTLPLCVLSLFSLLTFHNYIVYHHTDSRVCCTCNFTQFVMLNFRPKTRPQANQWRRRKSTWSHRRPNTLSNCLTKTFHSFKSDPVCCRNSRRATR